MTLSPTDIVSIVQFGSKNADKNRPLLIKCPNENKNWEFIRALKNSNFKTKKMLKFGQPQTAL